MHTNESRHQSEATESKFYGGPEEPKGLAEVEGFDPFDILDDKVNDDLNVLLGQLATNRLASRSNSINRKLV